MNRFINLLQNILTILYFQVAIDENLKQAELKREQRLMEVKEKQRIREEKAQRIRERVSLMLS